MKSHGEKKLRHDLRITTATTNNNNNKNKINSRHSSRKGKKHKQTKKTLHSQLIFIDPLFLSAATAIASAAIVFLVIDSHKLTHTHIQRGTIFLSLRTTNTILTRINSIEQPSDCIHGRWNGDAVGNNSFYIGHSARALILFSCIHGKNICW